MGSKLTKDEKRERDKSRLRERVVEKRAAGAWGAVDYALAREAAYRLLTAEEKTEFNRRKAISEEKRAFRESLRQDIQAELLWALKDGEDLDGTEVQARVRRLKMRRLNDPNTPLTLRQAQRLLRSP